MPAAQQPNRTSIGPYRIVARVGAGGMGEVFKGWDPRLERDVAIKLLHPEAAGDAARQRRLLAEGRAASALNHPNILRVYDADVDGESYYLVSEWLEGKSLRDELSRGPLALKRFLDVAVQIADGLAAAHANGIVHRDIKPENVMLAGDGTARIVDFGLARVDPHSPVRAAAAAHASTVTLENGLSGTPAYMSPEQARGQLGDFRTDQFSFGALMYEMATGKLAFRRDSLADTLSAVLNDEPPPVTSTNPRVPTAVAWIIEQCMAKEAGERYAATEDLARELRRVRERLRETATEGTPEPSKRHRAWLTTMAAIAATVIVMLAVATPLQTPTQELRFTPVASAAEYEGSPIWSPDGHSLAWVANVDGVLQVFVKRLADAVATQITRGRFDAEEPFWAPDSKTVYFISPAGEGQALWSVSAAGGRAELLIENVNHGAIDPSGRRFALIRNDTTLHQRLWWASSNGEDLTQESRGRFGERGFGLGGQLRFSPDGSELLVWIFNDRQRDEDTSSAYYLVSTAAGGPVRQVLQSVPSTANLPPVSWLPDNRHVVVGVADPSGPRHLWIADTRSDAKQRLTSTHTNESWPAASPDGLRIAYASEEVDFDILALSDDGRSQARVLATARNEMDPAWSPAGDQYAFVTDRGGPMEIWVRSRDGQWERPLVTATEFGAARTETLGALAFSPNGRQLAFQRRGVDRATIWLIPSTGGTPVQLIPEDLNFNFHDGPSWSPDGEWVSFTQSNGPEFSLAKIRVGSHEKVEIAERAVPFTRSAWSPDGEWIAAETQEGLVRIPAAGGAGQVILTEPTHAYAWADTRRLVALVESETIGHLAFIEIDAQTGDVRTLNPDLGTIPVANQPIRGLSFVKGRGFLTSLASARSDIWMLEGFELPDGRWLRWFRR